MTVVSYSFSQLEALWIQAGGNPTASPMAAAIAMAESGGDPNSTNHNGDGSTDRGLWQINSVHGPLSVYDPMGNAKAAVQISNNGTTWRPWCTAWSTGLCSGTYLGSGSPVFKFLPGGANTGGAPSGDSTGGGVPVTTVANPLNPASWAEAFLHPIGLWLFYGAMGALGSMLFIVGVALLIRDTALARQVKTALVGAATRGRATSEETD